MLNRSRGVVLAAAALALVVPSIGPASAADMPYPLEQFAASFLTDADIQALGPWGALVPDTPIGQECSRQPSGGYSCVRVYPVSMFGSKPQVLSARTFATPADASEAFSRALGEYRAKAERELAATPTDFSIQWTLDPLHYIVTSGRLDRNHYVEASCFARTIPGPRVEDVNTCTQLMLNTQVPRLAGFESPVVTPPPPPVGVLSNVSGALATVTWLPPESDGGAPITEYVATSTDGTLTCGTAPRPGLLQTCSAGGARAGVDYSFTVTSVNVRGASAPSAPSLPSRFTSVTSAPRSVSVRTAGTTAVVRWRKPARLGGLRILRYAVTATPGGASCTTSTTSCTVGGLDHATRYRFSVRAVNARGASRPVVSTWMRTAPAPPPPPAPAPAPIPAPAPPPTVDKPVQDPS